MTNLENTKCLYCKSDISGNFCSSCGKKNSSICDQVSFGEMQEYIHQIDNGRGHMSKQISEYIKSKNVAMSPAGLYTIFIRLGYMFRVVEEQFGNFQKIEDQVLMSILKEQGVSLGDRLKKATDHMDSQLEVDSFTLEGINKDYLIIKDIIDWFNEYIESNALIILERVKNGQYGFYVKSEEQINYMKYMFFRNAVWGYLYRVVEEQN